MKNKLIASSAAALAAVYAATPALAQDAEAPAEFYVGAQVGYHDLDFGGDLEDDGAIYGIYGGVDFPLGETLIGGIEGNYMRGSNAIQSEYGIAAKVGVRTGNGGQLFVRGGYQEVELDLSEVFSTPIPDGFDDSEGDYLVGAGGQFRLSPSTSFRVILDTIAFDTVRATAGVALHF